MNHKPHELGYYRESRITGLSHPIMKIEYILMAINANLTRIADALENQANVSSES